MAGGTRCPPSMSIYPKANRRLQSPFAAMMREGALKAKDTLMSHCDMRPAPEAHNVANKELRAPYNAPFPCVFGSNSQ